MFSVFTGAIFAAPRRRPLSPAAGLFMLALLALDLLARAAFILYLTNRCATVAAFVLISRSVA